jgi:hypothetical protein
MTSNYLAILGYILFPWRFQSIALTFLALSSLWRRSKARAQFLPGGLVVSIAIDRRRAMLKASEGMYLIRTGCPELDISNNNLTMAFSSSGVRYCWFWALSPALRSIVVAGNTALRCNCAVRRRLARREDFRQRLAGSVHDRGGGADAQDQTSAPRHPQHNESGPILGLARM